jgi:hypothetical protein
MGAALALALAFWVPRLSQFALMTIPFWLRFFMRRAERGVERGARTLRET